MRVKAKAWSVRKRALVASSAKTMSSPRSSASDPIQQLVGPHVLAQLSAHDQAALTGQAFFPHLVSAPFRVGLHEAFAFAIVACLVAAAALLVGAARGLPRARSALQLPCVLVRGDRVALVVTPLAADQQVARRVALQPEAGAAGERDRRRVAGLDVGLDAVQA